MNEERLVDIEIKLSRQEYLVDALNEVVCQQQNKISQLEKMCTNLAQHVTDMTGGRTGPNPVNERPPHY